MIDTLMGDLIDFESDMYEFMKNRFCSGVLFDPSLLVHINESLIGTNSLAEDLIEPSSLIMSYPVSLRTNLFPNAHYFLNTNDQLETKMVGENLLVKLLPSLERENDEKVSFIYEPDLAVKNLKKRLLSVFNTFIVGGLITEERFEILMRAGLLTETDVEEKFGGYRILSQKKFESNVRDFDKLYGNNTQWPKSFDSLQEYEAYYLGSKSYKVLDYFKTRLEANINFWSKPVISHDELLKQFLEFERKI